MRVGLVCPYDWSVPGGVQAQVAGLARSLGRRGLDITVIAPDGSSNGRYGDRRRATEVAPRVKRAAHSGEDEGKKEPTGRLPYAFIPVGRSMGIAGNGSIAPVAPGPAPMARTVRALRSLRPDVVHVHEPLTPGPSLAAILAGPRPIVATFHRSGTDRLYVAEGHLLGAAMKRVSAAVAVSEAAAETARTALGRHLRPGELAIVPNGVDLGFYASAKEAAERARAKHPPDRPTIVFVGRLEDRKGLRILLEAFGRLPPEVRLEVLGDGPLSAELRRQFPDDRIRWLGAAPDDDKARHLAAADLFVAPSIERESFGVVLLEAMAAGTAVVASDLPGYRLAAVEGARFVPPGDPHLLAAAITHLLADSGERQRLAAAGRRVATTFSMETIAMAYDDLYRSVRCDATSTRRRDRRP